MNRWLALITCLFPVLTVGPARADPGGAGASNITPSTYRVSERGLTLSLLAQVLYGRSARWKDIAQWNGLKPPYIIHVDKPLVLYDPVAFTPKQLDDRILNMWRARLARRDELSPRKSRLTLADPLKAREQIPTAVPPSVPMDAMVVPPTAPIHATVSSLPTQTLQEIAALEAEVLKSGDELDDQGKLAEELEVYRQFLTLHPQSAVVLYRVGKVYKQQEKYDLAVTSFEKSRKLDASQADPWLLEMSAFRKLKLKSRERHLALQFIRAFPALGELPFLQKFQTVQRNTASTPTGGPP